MTFQYHKYQFHYYTCPIVLTLVFLKLPIAEARGFTPFTYEYVDSTIPAFLE